MYPNVTTIGVYLILPPGSFIFLNTYFTSTGFLPDSNSLYFGLIIHDLLFKKLFTSDIVDFFVVTFLAQNRLVYGFWCFIEKQLFSLSSIVIALGICNNVR